MSDIDALLQIVLEADRSLRKARDAFLTSGEKRPMVEALEREVVRCFATNGNAEAPARLMQTADLLLEMGDGSAARVLFKILGHDDPAVRVAAGEALVELLYDRYAEIVRALEAEVEKGASATALAELPFILAEVGEPGGAKIMGRLLTHEDPDVVGAAVEGLAQMGDPGAIKSLEPLLEDARKVTLDEEDEEADEVTVGDLANEAIGHLRRLR